MQQKIEADITLALKSQDKKTAEALRFLKSTLINARIKLGHELSDSEVINIIRKEIKLREESSTIYIANQRQELAEKEQFEKSLFEKYVPKELDKGQIRQIISKIAKKIEQPVTFSNLMPIVIKEIAGKADGQTVATIVKDYLNEEVNTK